jgi:hypothetical protein
VIGLVETTHSEDLFRAADELATSLDANPQVRPKVVTVDVERKQVVCEVSIRCTLIELLESIDADCPTILNGGSASAGQFVRTWSW